MRRFFLPPDRTQGPTLILDGQEARHALDVLRLKRGDELTVLNGAGEMLECQIEQTGRREAVVRVVRRVVSPAPNFHITLLQAVPKGKIMDFIVQKAVELGAGCIVPILSEHCEVHYDGERSSEKSAKWRTTAIEAMKQCGATWMPLIHEPMTPEAWIARREPAEMFLIASLQPNARHLRAYFQNHRDTHGTSPKHVSVWVGPEGDFSRSEIEAILASGALPITLGPLVLRAETAALYCLSILQHELRTS